MSVDSSRQTLSLAKGSDSITKKLKAEAVLSSRQVTTPFRLSYPVEPFSQRSYALVAKLARCLIPEPSFPLGTSIIKQSRTLTGFPHQCIHSVNAVPLQLQRQLVYLGAEVQQLLYTLLDSTYLGADDSANGPVASSSRRMPDPAAQERGQGLLAALQAADTVAGMERKSLLKLTSQRYSLEQAIAAALNQVGPAFTCAETTASPTPVLGSLPAPQLSLANTASRISVHTLRSTLVGGLPLLSTQLLPLSPLSLGTLHLPTTMQSLRSVWCEMR